MAIEIHFKNEAAAPGKDLAIGEIVIEDFRESFESPLGYWSRQDYERQWVEGVGSDKAGAIQSRV